MRCRSLRCRQLGFRQNPGLGFEHDGDAVAHRKREPIGTTNEFSLVGVDLQASLAHRAHEDIEESGFHAGIVITSSLRAPRLFDALCEPLREINHRQPGLGIDRPDSFIVQPLAFDRVLGRHQDETFGERREGRAVDRRMVCERKLGRGSKARLAQ